MTAYRRPSLLTANAVEVSEHLLSKGIVSSVSKDETAMIIDIAGTSEELTAALSDFANLGYYRAALPADLPAHVQHLRDFYVGTTQQRAALTQAQRDHVLEDVIRVLKTLLDDRLA